MMLPKYKVGDKVAYDRMKLNGIIGRTAITDTGVNLCQVYFGQVGHPDTVVEWLPENELTMEETFKVGETVKTPDGIVGKITVIATDKRDPKPYWVNSVWYSGKELSKAEKMEAKMADFKFNLRDKVTTNDGRNGFVINQILSGDGEKINHGYTVMITPGSVGFYFLETQLKPYQEENITKFKIGDKVYQTKSPFDGVVIDVASTTVSGNMYLVKFDVNGRTNNEWLTEEELGLVAQKEEETVEKVAENKVLYYVSEYVKNSYRELDEAIEVATEHAEENPDTEVIIYRAEMVPFRKVVVPSPKAQVTNLS